MPAKIHVDTSKEIFGADVSIAHLAQHSFAEFDSQTGTIYGAAEIARGDWPHEIAELEMEHGTGIVVSFKDGSSLHVAAWGAEPEPEPEEPGRRFC